MGERTKAQLLRMHDIVDAARLQLSQGLLDYTEGKLKVARAGLQAAVDKILDADEIMVLEIESHTHTEVQGKNASHINGEAQSKSASQNAKGDQGYRASHANREDQASNAESQRKLETQISNAKPRKRSPNYGRRSFKFKREDGKNPILDEEAEKVAKIMWPRRGRSDES